MLRGWLCGSTHLPVPAALGRHGLLGHVNNVTYVDYLQEARVDMLRMHAPATGRRELAEGVVVVRHEVEFVAPLVFRLRAGAHRVAG